MLVTTASSISFTVASFPTARRASPTAIVITESSVKSQSLLNRSNSFVLSPLSNSNGLPIISPKIAPYIYASNLRNAPATLFLCYNTSIIERHLYMIAIRATLFRAKTNADTISTDVTYAPVTAMSPLAIFRCLLFSKKLFFSCRPLDYRTTKTGLAGFSILATMLYSKYPFR